MLTVVCSINCSFLRSRQFEIKAIAKLGSRSHSRRHVPGIAFRRCRWSNNSDSADPTMKLQLCSFDPTESTGSISNFINIRITIRITISGPAFLVLSKFSLTIQKHSVGRIHSMDPFSFATQNSNSLMFQWNSSIHIALKFLRNLFFREAFSSIRSALCNEVVSFCEDHFAAIQMNSIHWLELLT